MPLRFNRGMDSDSPQPTSADCEGALHPLAIEGIRLFDEGHYFEAHEALEAAWRDERGEIRHLYRGILQVAVGYYHIKRGNYTGARKLFVRCRQWLDPFPAACRGIDVAQLRQDALAVEAELIRLGPDHMQELDPRLIKPLPWLPGCSPTHTSTTTQP